MTEKTNQKTFQLQIKRIFSVPRERVYRAWTDPKELQKWWRAEPGYHSPFIEMDLRVGGTFRWAMKPAVNEVVHVAIGVFKEIIPNEKLVMTWNWEGRPAKEESLVTVEFHERGKDKTELVLTHSKFPTESHRDDHNKGWTGCIKALAEVVE